MAFVDMPGFVSQLSSLRMPTNMQPNPTYPKFVLVFGRRADCQDSELRRSRIRAEEKENFKIITFDSLAEGLSGKERLWLGVRRAEFTDLQDDEIVDENVFIWADPHMLTVSEELYARIEKVAANNKPTPIIPTGGGHLLSNLHPKALEV